MRIEVVCEAPDLISRGSQGLSKSSRDSNVPCKDVKLILRRDLDPVEMIDLKPDFIPDGVGRILEGTTSKDEKACEVSTFFNSNGWNYKPEFIPIYVYGQHENPLGSGAHQGNFGEAFLLHNTEVLKDLVLVCEEDVQNAAVKALARKCQMFSPSQSAAERIQILCDMLQHKKGIDLQRRGCMGRSEDPTSPAGYLIERTSCRSIVAACIIGATLR